MNYLDFAQGYKTIAGVIVLVLSLAGTQISSDEMLSAVTGVGQAIGAVMMAYGIVMKMVRKYKSQ